jgi:hypothetical protein
VIHLAHASFLYEKVFIREAEDPFRGHKAPFRGAEGQSQTYSERNVELSR